MIRKRSVLAVLIGSLVLVVWYGVAQNFPCVPASVNNLSVTSQESYAAGAPGLEEAPPGTWTTDAFEERLGGRISTLATDRSFSWIIAAPRETYSFPRYLAFHALTQVSVALLLVIFSGLLAPLARSSRWTVVLLFGVAASLATYGGMLNWWGMPAAYGVGESFNSLSGWLLAFLIIDWIGRGKATPQSA